jgi:DNA-binding response OmpR family regulator
MTRTLERQGFTAASVSAASELESTLCSSEFDVVLLDRSMEPPDGSTLVSVVREYAPRAKLLFFTGEFVDPDQRALVDGVVQKPINGKQLAAIIHELLG